MIRTTVIFTVATLMLLASCDKHQEEGGSVRMSLNMTVPQDASTGTMRVFVFGSDSGNKVGEYFLTQRAGNLFSSDVSIRCGQYDFLGYNFDIPDTYLRGESSLGTLQIYTNPVSENVRSRFILDQDETVVYSPDRVIMGSANATDISAGTQRLDLGSDDVTETWHIEIKADGVQYAAKAGCILSGEYTTAGLSNQDEREAGKIYFDLSCGSDCVYADYNSFGHQFGSDAEITIFVNNGEKVFNFTKNVGRIFDNAAKTESKRIEIDDKIVIPAPEKTSSDQGGFKPAVGEWRIEPSEILI